MKILKFTLVSFGIIMMISCKSVQTLVDQGDYDKAIAVATKKMRGDKVKKTKHIQALEKAFLRVNNNDLEEIEFLTKRGDLESWERIYDIAHSIEYRQELIAPYLPLTSKNGYRGRFDFVNANQILSKAGYNIKEKSYEKGQRLLELARAKDENALAREAYYYYQRVTDFDLDYKDVDLLIHEARELGKEHVLVETIFDSGLLVPYDIERFLDGVRYIPKGDEWVEYYTNAVSREEFDYIARLRINDIFLSPEEEKRRIFHEKKEIEDGLKYVLDENGNVKKDSLGNDIKVPNYIVVKARVSEVFRDKHLDLRAEIEVLDVRNKQSFIETIHADAHFEDYACMIRGDKRALSNLTRKRLRDYPLDFPSDIDLLFDTMDEVKRAFEREVAKMISKISV